MGYLHGVEDIRPAAKEQDAGFVIRGGQAEGEDTRDVAKRSRNLRRQADSRPSEPEHPSCTVGKAAYEEVWSAGEADIG